METTGKYQYAYPNNLFKSYYVVWKQYKTTTMENKKRSLNRTMQYGNEYRISAVGRWLESLNRTMQYGNKTSER